MGKQIKKCFLSLVLILLSTKFSFAQLTIWPFVSPEENEKVRGKYFQAEPTYDKTYEFGPFGEYIYWGKYLYELKGKETLFYESLKFKTLEEKYRAEGNSDSFLGLFGGVSEEINNMGGFNNLIVILDDSGKDIKHRFVLSNSILARFNPLCFNKEFPGLLWELTSPQNNITALFSRPETGRTLYRYYNKYLFALNLEQKFFENLKVGFSFANSHEEYGAPTGLKGTMDNIGTLQRCIYLKIYQVESDNYGAMVEGPFTVFIETDKKTASYSFTVGDLTNELLYLVQIGDPSYDAQLEGGTIRNSQGSTYILYKFPIPEGTLKKMTISGHIYSDYPGTQEEIEREIDEVVVAISPYPPEKVKDKADLNGYTTIPKSDWIDREIDLMPYLCPYLNLVDPMIERGYYLPGLTNYGINVELNLPDILDSTIKYNYVYNVQNRIELKEGGGGIRTDKTCTAYSFKFDTNLGGVELYGIDPQYDASDFVDYDRYREDVLISYKSEVAKRWEFQPSYKLDLDMNKNTIPDFLDDFLLFDIDRDFIAYEDNNYNGVLDYVERTGQPLYGHRVGREGSSIYGILDLDPYFLKIGNQEEKSLIDLSKEKSDFYTIFGYEGKLNFPKIDLLLQYRYDSIKTNLEDNFLKTGPNGIDIDNDSIDSDNDGYCDGQERRDGTNPNDSTSYPVIPIEDRRNWIDEDDELYKEQIDMMPLRDAKLHTFLSILRYEEIKNLIIEGKYKYRKNVHYYDFLSFSYSDISENQAILKIKQDFYPLSNFVFSPMYKLEYRNGVTTPFGYSPKYNTLSHVGILKFTYDFTKNTSLIFGLQGILYSDYKDSWYDYISGAFDTEVVCRGKIAGVPVVLLLGYKLNNQNFTYSGREDKKEQEMFIRVVY